MGETSLAWDERGLIPVVVQDRLTGEVRMVAWANAEALARTRDSRQATFWSRSRQEIWVKGATSGHTMGVTEIRVDCDGDTLLYLVDPAGPSCHTGTDSCFFRPLEGVSPAADRAPFPLKLGAEISARRSATSKASYVKSLLDGGASAVGAKLREEAGEFADALENETDERVCSEAADLVFHMLVALEKRGLALRDVWAILATRFGVGGHAEKAARPPK